MPAACKHARAHLQTARTREASGLHFLMLDSHWLCIKAPGLWLGHGLLDITPLQSAVSFICKRNTLPLLFWSSLMTQRACEAKVHTHLATQGLGVPAGAHTAHRSSKQRPRPSVRCTWKHSRAACSAGSGGLALPDAKAAGAPADRPRLPATLWERDVDVAGNITEAIGLDAEGEKLRFWPMSYPPLCPDDRGSGYAPVHMQALCITAGQQSKPDQCRAAPAARPQRCRALSASTQLCR